MKKFISLFIASVIIGFAVFAIDYWVLGSGFTNAQVLAVTASITALIVEYLRPTIAKWSKMLDITARSKPSKR